SISLLVSNLSAWTFIPESVTADAVLLFFDRCGRAGSAFREAFFRQLKKAKDQIKRMTARIRRSSKLPPLRRDMQLHRRDFPAADYRPHCSDGNAAQVFVDSTCSHSPRIFRLSFNGEPLRRYSPRKFFIPICFARKANSNS